MSEHRGNSRIKKLELLLHSGGPLKFWQSICSYMKQKNATTKHICCVRNHTCMHVLYIHIYRHISKESLGYGKRYVCRRRAIYDTGLSSARRVFAAVLRQPWLAPDWPPSCRLSLCRAARTRLSKRSRRTPQSLSLS